MDRLRLVVYSIIVSGLLLPLSFVQSQEKRETARQSRSQQGDQNQSQLEINDLKSRMAVGAVAGQTVADLMTKAQTAGSVRVIVGLRLDFQPEGELALVGEIEAQRRSIAQAQTALLNRLSAYRISSVKRFDYIPFIALEVDAAGLDLLGNEPEVATIEEDALMRATLAESVALIGAPAAWAGGFAGAGQVVAILDTGVDKNHPFLAGKVVSEACYSTTSSSLGTTSVCPAAVAQSTAAGSGVNCSVAGCEHGTHVAGTAAGKSATFNGVARDANIIAIQVFSRINGCASSVNCVAAFTSDILLGLQRVYQLRTNFNIAAANLSLGGFGSGMNCDATESAYKMAIDNLRSAGIATVVASGNDGNPAGLSRPACVSSAISVGSTGDGSESSTADAVSGFSNSASFLNLLAPGEWINSSIPGSGFASFRGTSQSAPHVTGAWAVLKSKTPAASVAQVLQAFSDNGLSINDTRNSIAKPRIRVDAAVTALPATACNYSITPATQSLPKEGGSGTVNVTANGGCAWTAKSNAPWITITSAGSGSGNGSVSYTVAANTGLERGGTILVAGTIFAIKQSGVQTLAIDDGVFENAIGLRFGGSICAVNRLTPGSYPSAINGVAAYFPSQIGLPVGAPVTILYGVNPRGGTDISGVAFQTINSTVQALDQFILYPIPPIAATSGDFVVGFCLTHSSNQLPIVIDQSSSRRRSYLSLNGGSYQILEDISSSLAGSLLIRATLAPQFIMAGAATLTAENCATANQAIDPGEMVTVNLPLQNAGTDATGNLVATLQTSGGVTAPTGPQTYGALPGGGAPVTRSFTFKADPALACGGALTVTLQLQDGATSRGNVSFNFNLGPSVTKTYSYSGSPVTIPDPGTVEIPITVTDVGIARDLNVRVRLNHTWDSDLDIFLVGPDGSTVELSTDNGGLGDNYGSGSNNCNGAFTVFDDAAATSITSGSPPFAGPFKPEGSLSAFNGKPVNGQWKLRITDDVGGDGGSLGCWQLEIARQPGPCCGSSCPFIANANTTIGQVGASVVLTGVNFTGVTGVKFANNVAANFTINSDTQITTSVPAGAVTGPLTVSKSGCPDLQLDFTVIICPTVSGLDPASGLIGSTVNINGANLTGVSAVKFSNNVNAQFSVNSATRITATVPTGAVTGPLTISRPGCPDLTTASFKVCSAITLSPTSLPAGTVGAAYNRTITASGGASPYNFAVSSGTLPAGLTLSPAGVLSGTPTQSSNASITIRATDANGCSGTRSYSLVITCPTVTLSPTTLPAATVGAAYNRTITASGGASPYSFTASAGALPNGLTLSSTGVLSGSPTQAGNFNFTVRATDANGCTGSRSYSLVVNCTGAITLAPATLPNGVSGSAYNQTITASGGTAPYSFAVTSGILPIGLTLSSGGVISGTPLIANTFNFTVTGATAIGCVGSRSYTITITGASIVQPGLLYVLNNRSSGSQIYGYSVNEITGALTPLAGFPVSTGGSGDDAISEQLTIDRANRRLYAINNGSNTVSAYAINPATGALTPMPFSPINLGAGEWITIATHPSGSPLVVGDGGGSFIPGRLASYQITGTTATAAAGSPYSTGGAFPFSSAFSQDGNYVYTGGNSGSGIAGFSVNAATGVLTALTGSPFDSGGSSPLAYATDAVGRLFTASFGGGQTRVFTTSSGIPTGVTGNPFTSGLGLVTHGLPHPNGFYLVSDFSGGRVGVYRVNGSGSATTLSAVTGSPFTGGGGFSSTLALNQTGAFLFLANGSNRSLTTFGVNLSTGVLTKVNTQPTNTMGSTDFLTGMAYLPVTSTQCPTIALSPSALPNGVVGAAYNQSVSASPAGSYTFAVTAGALPAGLSLNQTTGAITGTPTTAGAANFTITATGAAPCSGSQAYTLSINNPTPNITGLSPNTRTAGSAGFKLTINGSNFVNGAVAQWNGNNRTTTFVNSSQLMATIPYTDIINEGAASVTVINPAPAAGPSSAASFNITPPVAARTLRVVGASGSTGGNVIAPIELVSQGDEAAISFSVTFDPAVLANPQVALGADAAGATLNTNASQASQGRYGVTLSLPGGQTFSAGARRILNVTFTIAANTSASSSNVGFGDQPVSRIISDPSASPLPSIYTPGAITITQGVEADVAPRSAGNGSVTTTDWAQVGRFVAGLDTAAVGSEFQRADCAPRNTLGDGRLTVTDWVQAGRYATANDPLTPAGGPTAPSNSVVAATRATVSGKPVNIDQNQLHRVNAFELDSIGRARRVAVSLDARGDENALGFSLLFNPSQWRFVSAIAGRDARGATLRVNANEAARGRIGLAMALPAGQPFDSGAREVVILQFAPRPAETSEAPLAIGFGDQPVAREIVTAEARALPGDFTFKAKAARSIAIASAASLAGDELAPEQIATIFGERMAASAEMASVLPLPVELGGARVIVTDSAGAARQAPLLFASPQQINFLVPAGTATGTATIMVINADGEVSIGVAEITEFAPSLFAANSDGQGAAAAIVLRVRAGDERSFEPAVVYDPAQNRFIASPIDLGAASGEAGEEVFLILFGTGLGAWSSDQTSLAELKATVGAAQVEVTYAGPQGEFAGLDQINLRLPGSMAGSGEVEVALTINGKRSNAVRISIK